MEINNINNSVNNINDNSNKNIKYEYNEISFSNGNLYRGELKLINDKDPIMQGKGILYINNGDYYIGDFNNDNLEGFGMYICKEEHNRYIGQFKNNKYDGFGKFRYNNGNEYHG